MGDWDGDGYADVTIAAPAANGYSGEVMIYYGGAELTLGGFTVSSGAKYTGSVGDVLGFHLGDAGDLDADGYADLVVTREVGDTVDGKPYLVYGGPTRLTGARRSLGLSSRASLSPAREQTPPPAIWTAMDTRSC